MGENQTNLIINYLPQTYTDDEFYALFANYGTINSSKICRDKNTGYSYGFGFVDYATPDMAQTAIMSLNGYEIENKRIKVALARPPGEDSKGANLYVSNLPTHYDENGLRALFQRFGNIVQTRVLKDHSTGMSKGVGFVLFERKNDAQQGMNELNGHTPTDGTVALNIKFADANEKKVRPPAGQRGGYASRGGRGGYDNFNMYNQRGGGGQGGPMRGPGSRNRFNPMSAGGGQNGYGSYGGGYSDGYAPRGRGGMRGGRGRGGYQGQGQGGYGGQDQGGYGAQGHHGQQQQQHYGGGDFGGGYAAADDGAGVILFAYNIGVDATEADLWNLFSPYGMIKKVNVIWDHQKNQCKGYGFVTMSTLEEANCAIEYLNGFYYKQAPLQVSIKSEKQ